MKKRKICFIAQFPPPIHGLSKAVDTLYHSNLADEFEFEKVNLTDNNQFVKNLYKVWKSSADLFYFTISQTKGGNLRDLVLFKMLEWKKRKCLVHLHGGRYRELVDNELPKWQKSLNYKAIKKIAGTIVLSSSLKSIFQGMIDEDKIYIVPNCVDDQYLMSDKEFEVKSEALIHKEVLQVLYLSNFIRSKGYPQVLEMATLEKDRVEKGAKKQLHFNFAGQFFDNKERVFFESYIREHELKEFITYHGVVNGQQKKDLLKQCDIFTLLTRYPNEGQPISILEAMGNGMIIVTTDHAGIPDIVTDGINGIIVSDDFKETRAIYTRLYDLKDQSRIIGVRNRTTCISDYCEIEYLKKMSCIFKDV
ncbi:glycosyltransferase family 4 protein [Paenibacillus sp. PL2-23]|uniref:glycosyltransferase family 4 protein n=1 Tax=Paenibacillus sp. PL2-23 TaxID=2100729 RepID=UPI0030F8B35D